MFEVIGKSRDINSTVDQLNNLNDGYEYEEITVEEYANTLPENQRQRIYNKYGMAINFHYMISEKTIDRAYDVIKAMQTDPRLVGNINAIVFLSLKQKGRGTKYDYVTQEQYKALVDHCLANEVPFGFDSCSAAQFLESVEGTPNYTKFLELSEPCESTLFSSYVSETGVFFPCSFTEGWVEGGWSKENGINVLEAEDFIRDVWNHPRTVEFRHALIGNTDERGCRNCPAYEVCGKKGYMLELTETGYQHVSTEPVGDITITEVV